MLNRDDQYFYAKERRKFGRQCIFGDHNELLFDEPPNKEYMDEYILRNPVDSITQLHKIYALSECLTINPEMRGRGMNHVEGGWPKDLNPFDEEQTTRQRKKIMREDSWAQKMPQLLKTMEKAVLQNGAIDIYEKYFEGLEGIPQREDFSGKTVGIFKDKKEPSRPVSCLSWSPDGSQICGGYSVRTFKETASREPTSFIWNIENPNVPSMTLNSKTPIMSIQYNTRDQFLLAGGLLSGEIVIWDQRSGGTPTLLAEREISHGDRVNSLLWTSSKTNTEFFTGSADGSVFFWDTRNMATPIENMFLDPVETNDQNKSRSYGVSILEFEPTIPTRFMIGSDQGFVFSCNRKGRTATEKIIAKFRTNLGCIYSLERNSAFPKNFLTIGDWGAKIWSDEWRDAPTMWMANHSVPLLSGAWSKTRCSLFFITKYDGSFEAWDLLIQQDNPIMRIKLSPSPLLCCAAHDNGEWVATAGNNGFIYLVRLSDNMVTSSKIERPAFSLMVDRETRREKAYDSRLREVKLKMRKEQEKEEGLIAQEGKEAQDNATNNTEQEEAKKKQEQEKMKKDQDEAEKKKKEEAGQKIPEEGVSAKASAHQPPGTETDTMIPHGGPPMPEEAEEEVVIDLVEANEKEFYTAVEKEMNKRGSYEVIPVLTPFDPDFDMSTIMKPEDIEAEHKQRIKEIKAKVIKGLLKLYKSQHTS